MEHICLISSFLLINGQYVSALIVTVRIIANESLLNVYISQNKWQKCYFLHFFVFPAVLKTYRTMTFVYCYSPSTNQHGQYIGSLLTSHWITSIKYIITLVKPTLYKHMLSSPDLQLSSTTCWISPPKKGTLTNSSCSRFRADAKPVTRGTYLREFVGPAQFRMTKVLRLTHRKSLNGCGLVRRTHFR